MGKGMDLADAILLAVARLTAERQDTDGPALLSELRNAGRAEEGRLVYLRAGEMREDGLIEFHKGGGGPDLDTVDLLRLTSAGRAKVKELQPPERLPRGQHELLLQMVEAARDVPRNEQQWHSH